MTAEPPPPNENGNEVMSGSGETEDQIWRWIIRQLGGSVVDVELTNHGDRDPVTQQPIMEGETNRDDIFKLAKEWYAFRVGAKKIIQIMINNRQSAYLMPRDCIEVISLWLPSFQLPTLDADQFSYTYFSMLFGQWTNPSMPMPFSDLVQRLQYLETAGRIFSSDRDWYYNASTRILEILPAPAAVGSLNVTGTSAPALVTIWSSHVDTTQMDPMDLSFFRRRALAEATKVLAAARSKFDSVMSIGGDRALAGADLAQQVMDIMDKLEMDVMNWKRTLPIITG